MQSSSNSKHECTHAPAHIYSALGIFWRFWNYAFFARILQASIPYDKCQPFGAQSSPNHKKFAWKWQYKLKHLNYSTSVSLTESTATFLVLYPIWNYDTYEHELTSTVTVPGAVFTQQIIVVEQTHIADERDKNSRRQKAMQTQHFSTRKSS